jgi:hypothetical protein
MSTGPCRPHRRKLTHGGKGGLGKAERDNNVVTAKSKQGTFKRIKSVLSKEENNDGHTIMEAGWKEREEA